MSQFTDALFKLYPNAVKVENNTTAYDADGNEVAYDLQAVTAQAEAEKTQVEAIKTSALDKLTALGLTQDEIKAILGITL
jgi:hypothetical protein